MYNYFIYFIEFHPNYADENIMLGVCSEYDLARHKIITKLKKQNLPFLLEMTEDHKDRFGNIHRKWRYISKIGSYIMWEYKMNEFEL